MPEIKSRKVVEIFDCPMGGWAILVLFTLIFSVDNTKRAT